MLTFELLKLLPNKTKAGPAWTTVWDRWSPEILSTINYSTILGSIITGAPTPQVQEWCKWLPNHLWDCEKTRSGTWTILPTGVVPAETSRKPPDIPTGILPRAAEPGALASRGWGPECCLEGRSPRKLSLPGEQASRSSPFLGPSEPKCSLTWGHTPQLPPSRSTAPRRGEARGAWLWHQKGGFLGSALRAVGRVQKPRTPSSPQKSSAHRGEKKVLCCFCSPFRLLKAWPFSEPHWVVGEGELSLTPVLPWAKQLGKTPEKMQLLPWSYCVQTPLGWGGFSFFYFCLLGKCFNH